MGDGIWIAVIFVSGGAVPPKYVGPFSYEEDATAWAVENGQPFSINKLVDRENYPGEKKPPICDVNQLPGFLGWANFHQVQASRRGDNKGFLIMNEESGFFSVSVFDRSPCVNRPWRDPGQGVCDAGSTGGG